MAEGGKPHRRGTTAAVRANTIVEPGGREIVNLDVYCPACDEWLPVDHQDDPDAQLALAAHAAPPEVPGDNDWGRTPISEIMTRRVVCVRDGMSVAQLAGMFVARKLGGAPVVDGGGDLIGVVTRTDLLRIGWEGPGTDTTLDDDPKADGWSPDDELAQLSFADLVDTPVAQVMTPFAFALASHAPVAQAAALMSFEGISRMVVVSTDGTVVGLLTARDILRWLAQQAGYVIPDPVARRSAELQTVGADAPDPVTGRHHRRGTEPGARPRLVMIIDDDASVREDYAELLRDEGYQVLTAANGLEALDQLQAVTTPSLILLDLKMPVMDGWKFHTKLACDPLLNKVPVVLLSGSSDVYEEAARMDADDFLLKPVPVRELLGTVEQYCS